MASLSKSTTDHEEIKRWAEERGGKPAHVSSTGQNDDIGILRLEFPGAPGSQDDQLDEITWEQFFDKFDERNLALVYEEKTAAGERSNFNKLVSGESAKRPARKKAVKSSAARTAKKAPAAKKKAAAPLKKKSAAPAKKAPAGKTVKRAVKGSAKTIKKTAKAAKGSAKKAAGRRR